MRLPVCVEAAALQFKAVASVLAHRESCKKAVTVLAIKLSGLMLSLQVQHNCLTQPRSDFLPLAAAGAPCLRWDAVRRWMRLEHSHFCAVCSHPLMLLIARCLSLLATFTAFCCCCAQHLRELQADVVMSFGVPTAAGDCCGCMLSDALGGVPWIDVYGHPIIYSPISVPQVGAGGVHAA